MRIAARIAAFALMCSVRLFADPMADQWIDKVTHEVQKSEGPLSTKPLEYHLEGGVFGYFTDNLFLSPNRRAIADYAAIGFGRGSIEYVDSRLEIAADLLATYDFYFKTYKARGDQEHFYGKIRYADGRIDAQLVEIARHQIDGLDGVFAERANSVVTDTLPRLEVRITDLFSLYGFGAIQTVHFVGSKFDSRENENYRFGVGALADATEWLKIGGEVGYTRISYRDTDITPNSDGYFVRASARTEVTEDLLIEAAVGYSSIHAFHTEPGSDRRANEDSYDAEIHVVYPVTPDFTVFADYIRRFGFAGSTSSYESLDRGVVIGEWQITETFKARARAQYDYVRPSNSPNRAYASAGFSADYDVDDHITLEGGMTVRWGNTLKLRNDNYDNWVIYLGFIVGL